MFKNILSYLVIILTSCLFISNIYATSSSDWDISTTSFKINVLDLTPGWDNIINVAGWGSQKQVMANILAEIIYDLMVAIWVTAILTMTIGWAYMIIYAWQDDLLSKWKTIFKTWLIALSVALLSWLLIKLVSFLLY